MNSAHILVVDDDTEICELLSDYLSKHEYKVSTANNGQQMRRIIHDSPIDLIVLDVMLPGEDGLSLCKQITAEYNTPILMLSAQGEDTDRIVGLEIGADDYLSKPFNPRELLARIKALLRHRHKAQDTINIHNNHDLLQFGTWRVDPCQHILLNAEDVVIPLTQGEYQLLQVLLEHPHHVLSRNQLLELTHGREAGPFDRTIDVQIGRLRKKLEHDPKEPEIIKTIRGGGYQFCCDVIPVKAT